MVKTIDILSTPVACVDYQSAVEALKKLAKEPRPTSVCPANTHILAEARRDPSFAEVLSEFDLILPDGMPVVWALNRAGAGLTDRVYGPILLQHLVRAAPAPWRHFFFGDTEECLRALEPALRALQPNVEIAGMLSPPFRPWTEADETEFAEAINAANPDFVWVGLPGVRMERWILDNRARYRRGCFVAVGDGLSLLAGRRQPAPDWMQRHGLTWLYRMAHEPRRLGPRYARYNTLFVYYSLLDEMRRVGRR